MKRGLILSALYFAVGFFTGCEELFNEIPIAETDYYEIDFTVQASDLQGFQIFIEEEFDSELDKILNESGIPPELLESVTLKEADLSITSQGTYYNFDVMKFVELTVYHDSLGEKKIALLNPIPPGRSAISLELSTENLLPYFRVSTFILTAQGFLRERIHEDMELNARVKFEIKGGK